MTTYDVVRDTVVLLQASHGTYTYDIRVVRTYEHGRTYDSDHGRTSISCISHVRHRTYDIAHDVMSYVARTMSYVMHVRHHGIVDIATVGGKNPDVQLDSRSELQEAQNCK